jgi:16S rRNA (cytosine967-C5)-methyltransferase
MTNPRDIAAHVLSRVDKQQAFAAAALEAELGRAVQLDARDRALTTELVYGSLRVQPWLVREIARFVPRGMDRLDVGVRAHLVIAAYQLFFMRVPAFAAVSEAVGSVRTARGTRVAAFANAVLRRVAERAKAVTDEEREAAVFDSAPAWMRSALERALSPEGARALLRSGAEPPAVAIRVERASERATWLERLSAAAPQARFEAGSVSPMAILGRGAGKPQRLPGWSEGAWSVQEEGAQLAAMAAGAREGSKVLDACAGRGNKTAVLARAVGETGVVDAGDSSPAKLARLESELARLGLRVGAAFAVDWTVGSGDVSGEYDCVLVDAPCTGVGTLRRRPEIALRRENADLDAMTRTQVAIVTRAAAHVRKGGSLVYVVCSVLREEGEDVIDTLLQARPELLARAFEVPEVRALAGDAPFFRLLPHVHGTDGYFIARLVRP